MPILKFLTQLKLIVPILFLCNCTWNEISVKDINGVNKWNPELVVPLGQGEFEVWDLIDYFNEIESNVEKDSTGLLHVYISGANVGSISANQIVKLPASIRTGKRLTDIGDYTLESNVLSTHTLALKEFPSEKGIPNFNSLGDSPTIFPPIDYRNTEDPLSFKIATKDFSHINIKSGLIYFEIINQLNVPIKLKGRIIDKDNKNFELCSFDNIAIPVGTKPVLVTQKLTDQYVTKNLIIQIQELSTLGSYAPVEIDINKGLSFVTRFSDLTITEGEVNLNNKSLKNQKGTIDIAIDDYKFKELKLKSGLMILDFNLDIKGLNGEIEVKFPSIKDERGPLKKNVGLINSKGKATIDLKNLLIDLGGKNGEQFNTLSYELNIKLNEKNEHVSFHSTDHITLSIDLRSPRFNYLYGDFGQQKITISEGSFDDNFDYQSYVTGQFHLADPKFILTTENSFGIPIKADFQLVGKNTKGGLIKLNPTSFFPRVAKVPTMGMVLDTFLITKENSSIIEFTDLPPEGGIKYSGVVELNPHGAPDKDCLNWITETSQYRIHIDTDIPIAFRASNIGYRDTFTYNLKWPEELDENYFINLYVRNEIPMDIEAEVSILSADKRVLATPIESLILKKGILSDDGVTLEQGENAIQIEMTDQNIDALKKGIYLSFSGTLCSPNAGYETTTIYANQKLNICLSASTQVNIAN